MTATPLTDAHLNQIIPEDINIFDLLLSFTKSLELKYNNLLQIITEDCETEEQARKIALKVLPEIDVHGDSFGVPTLSDITQLLVDRINTQREIIDDLIANASQMMISVEEKKQKQLGA